MKTWHVVAFVVVGVAILAVYTVTPFFASTTTTVSPSRNNVVLSAPPGNETVQMFAELRNGPDVRVITFPDGFGCIKLGDRIPHHDGGGTLYFYHLDCNGTTGYVNADWVRVR